ncbi:four F5 protein [Meira miltonrushii]|uniref:Four F5 protein n=1 Tax=Meira miltonrushii TaxID=1280837 RepID=A0A316V4T3_9BASI|nr:four F5 protein [Meira miltonrushii]PWN32028.1 four F5 protein [Meira miltonrushii]
MTRGNQRDLARAKNAKKQADATKGKRDDGLTVAQRKQRDADAMRAKQEAAKAKADGKDSSGK